MVEAQLYAALIAVTVLAAASIGVMAWALRMVASQAQMNLDYFKTVSALIDELKSERAEQN